MTDKYLKRIENVFRYIEHLTNDSEYKKIISVELHSHLWRMADLLGWDELVDTIPETTGINIYTGVTMDRQNRWHGVFTIKNTPIRCPLGVNQVESPVRFVLDDKDKAYCYLVHHIINHCTTYTYLGDGKQINIYTPNILFDEKVHSQTSTLPQVQLLYERIQEIQTVYNTAIHIRYEPYDLLPQTKIITKELEIISNE